jgi:hypothetical protein
MAATEGPVRATEFKKARAAANETSSDMEVDHVHQPVSEGEDLYSRLKLWQRQQEFNEIQVRRNVFDVQPLHRLLELDLKSYYTTVTGRVHL